MRKTVSEALEGVSGIVISPFAADGIDVPTLARIVDRAVTAGVDNLVAAGNTSEFYASDEHEIATHIRETSKAVERRAIVTAGVGRSLRAALRMVDEADKASVDAIMVHQPLEPFASPRGTVAYVHHIADHSRLPVVLYIRNDIFDATEIRDLLAHPRVIGAKYAFADLALFGERVRSPGAPANNGSAAWLRFMPPPFMRWAVAVLRPA